MTISPISNLKKTCSPVVFIHGIPWKVEVSKDEDENSLALYLECAKKDDPSNWTVPACATVKLLPFNGEAYRRVHHITPYVFGRSSCLLFGTSKLIQWNELLDDENEYVRDDTIELKIGITAEDPNYVNRSILRFETIDKSCDCGSHATFRLTIANVKNLMAVRSPQFIARGLPWDLSVYKSQSATLGIMLEAKKATQKVSCKMTMSAKLISFDDDADSIEMDETDTVQWPTILDIENILAWDKMLNPKNGYINNDSITLDVEIKADKPEGGATNADFSCAAKRGRFECSVCLESMELNQDISVTECGHIFCTACITKAVKDRHGCPLCNAAVQLNKLRRIY